MKSELIMPNIKVFSGTPGCIAVRACQSRDEWTRDIYVTFTQVSRPTSEKERQNRNNVTNARNGIDWITIIWQIDGINKIYIECKDWHLHKLLAEQIGPRHLEFLFGD